MSLKCITFFNIFEITLLLNFSNSKDVTPISLKPPYKYGHIWGLATTAFTIIPSKGLKVEVHFLISSCSLP